MITYGAYQDKTGRQGKAAHNSEATNQDGIFAHIGDRFEVRPGPAGGQLSVSVGSGKAKFDGTWTLNNEALSLPLPPADPALPRIDTVVLEVGRGLFGVKNRILAVPGLPGQTPVPAGTEAGRRKRRYPLAEIRVAPGADRIAEGDIRNLAGTARCPFTTDLRFRSSNQCTDHRNDPALVRELLEVGWSYYRVRGSREAPTFLYNQSDPACFDRGFDPENPALRRNIDCSTYIGLLLRGIPYEKSPYKGLTGAGLPGPGMTAPNRAEYSWAMDPGAVKLSVNPDEAPKPLRTASQLAEWLEKQNLAIQLEPDLSNVEPGDIIFWAKTRATGEYLRPRRYRKISHIAVCCSKLPQPETVTASDKAGLKSLRLDGDRVLRNLITLIDGGALPASRKDHGGKGTGEYWMWLKNGVWTVTRAPDKGETPREPLALRDAAAFGFTAEPESGEASFTLEVFYWDPKYPFKHTMLEVSTTAPYVLNRTLEKSRPGSVVLVCRPRLVR